VRNCSPVIFLTGRPAGDIGDELHEPLAQEAETEREICEELCVTAKRASVGCVIKAINVWNCVHVPSRVQPHFCCASAFLLCLSLTNKHHGAHGKAF
jgi:hypothetical protein